MSQRSLLCALALLVPAPRLAAMSAMRPLLRWSCPLLLALSAVLHGSEGDPVHYWNGAVRVEAELARDELQVTGADPVAAMAAASKGGFSVATAVPTAAGGASGQRTQLRFAAIARGTLEAAALRLGKGFGGINAVLYAPGAPRRPDQAGILSRQLSLRLKPGQDVAALAKAYHLQVVERVGYSPDTYILAAGVGSLTDALDAANALYEREGAVFATPLILRQHARRDTPADPQFATQWHLRNLGTGSVTGGVAGNDINVTPWWNLAGDAHLGAGINIGMVDDGLEQTHEDLQANVRADLAINFNGAPGGPTDPSPGINDFHGTWTSGLVAAVAGNSKGGCGVAPRAHLIGIRLLSGSVTDSQDAQALSHLYNATPASNRIHVSSNSWGPSDFPEDDPTLAYSAPGPLLLSALQTGTTSGRGGKGIVYAWAGGNGREDDDNMAYDGFASSRYVIAVGAIAPDGVQASYSESGPGLLVCAPGGDFGGQGIVTTDRTGKTGTTDPRFKDEDFAGNYTTQGENLVGTSFAAPLVSGVAALLLEANPALTWRDVQHALVRTAAKNDGGDGGWQRAADNGYGVPGRFFNHKYGYGRVDANAAATAVSSSWVLAPAESAVLAASEAVAVSIPDNVATGISRSLVIGGAASGYRIEHVELTVSVTHPYRGDLHFQLTSPRGMVTDIQARNNDFGANLSHWTFTSAAHWGENPNGTWTLKVADELANDVGALTAWSLSIHGYAPHPTPSVSGLSPMGTATGSAITTVTITGSGFVEGVTQVRWDGTLLASTVNTSSQLSAVIPAANLAASGTHAITLTNPDFDGGADHVSSAQSFIVSTTPTISAASTATTAEDTPVAIAVTVGDVDTALASLTMSATSADPAKVAVGNLVFSGSGSARTLTVTPAPDATGTVALTVTVSDGVSSASQVVNLTITPVDDPPVAQSGRFRTPVSTVLTDAVTGFDIDSTGLTFAVVTPPAAGAGTISMAPTGAFTFTPVPGFRGLAVFEFRAMAGVPSTTVQGFITVGGDPNGVRPLIVSEPAAGASDEQVAVGGTFTYTVVADTSRYTLAPTLTYDAVGAPSGIMKAGNVFSWTASGADRHLSFAIVVQDTLTKAFDTQTVVLRVVAGGATN